MTPILPITVYSFHLILLSCLNIALLSLNAFEFGMGLSIFGHGNKGTAHWEPDPTDRRGTWTILLTCIITLTLCVYTSLHLNVPSHKSSTGFAIGMKAKYVIFGLLAPELMVFNAWRQRTVASSIVATLRKDRGVTPRISWFRRLLQGLQTSTRKTYQSIKSIPKLFIGGLKKEKHERGLPSVADKDPWADVTLVHGFYMVMGGYAFDASRGPKPRIWPRKVDRLTPSPMAILGCLTSQDKSLREILPYLSEEEIWDKSKANGLAKAIVCIQAAWFCTQCIARLGQGIPISLLELNTFAHAICALLIYILWWSKPLDVHEPTVIDVGQSETARSICALAWSGPQAPVPHLRRVSPADNRLWKRFLNRFGHFIGTFSECYLGDGPLLSSPILSRSSTSNQQRSAQIADLERPLALTKRPTSFEGLDVEQLKSRVWVSTDPPAFVLKGGEAIPSTSLHVSTEWKTIDVDEVLLERLGVVEKLQNQANYAAYGKCFSRLLDTTDPDLCMLKPRELNFTDSLMRQNSNVSSVDGNLTGAAGIILSGVVYGGLHAIAWGSTAFSSPLEDLAWKISCFIVAGGGLFIFAGIYGLKMMTKRKPANGRIDATKVLVYGSAPIFIAFFLLYLVCRVYLVFEVFRNLAYLDPRVYKTPKWQPSTHVPEQITVYHGDESL
ncbi:MAG: hypothetical protein LQ346_005202 [Caloplaca aetnensis]|nr:MAG: hypothetical protein LQ346_005202 [Caloplaca aetnensis]